MGIPSYKKIQVIEGYFTEKSGCHFIIFDRKNDVEKQASNCFLKMQSFIAASNLIRFTAFNVDPVWQLLEVWEQPMISVTEIRHAVIAFFEVMCFLIFAWDKHWDPAALVSRKLSSHSKWHCQGKPEGALFLLPTRAAVSKQTSRFSFVFAEVSMK